MLTPKQKQIFEYIKKYAKKKGYSPTQKEIGKRFGLVKSTVHQHIESLKGKGYLNKLYHQARAIEISKNEKSDLVKIPLLGTIAAGQPIEAIEDKETIKIPKSQLSKSGEHFALRVSGDSMIKEGIFDGDIVVIRKQPDAENGETVVALINDNEVTLKKIYKEKNGFRLQPANPTLKPIFTKELMVHGKVITVVRNFKELKEKVALKNKSSIQNNKVINAKTQEWFPINKIICGDAIKLLDRLKLNSIDMVLSDIPYGISIDEWDVLHNNTNRALLGQSPAQKGKKAFKRRGKPIRGWSNADKNIPREYQEWCYSWARKLFPIVKEGASVFIFAGRRMLHRAIIALEDSGFLLRDILAWEKPSAHHRAQSLSNLFKKRGLAKVAKEWEGWKLGNLAPKYEPIAWLFKPYTTVTITDNVLENKLGAMNVEACSINGKSPTNILKFGFQEGENGLHETQKPVSLLEYLIKLVTCKRQLILDPFIGSGSTAVACKRLGRKYIGFEISKDYCEIAKKRLAETNLIKENGREQNRLF